MKIVIFDWDDTIVQWSEDIRQKAAQETLSELFLKFSYLKEGDKEKFSILNIDQYLIIREQTKDFFKQEKNKAFLDKFNLKYYSASAVFVYLFFDQLKVLSEQDQKAFIQESQTIFRTNSAKHLELYDGALDAIKSLKENGYQLAILSNKNENDFRVESQKIFEKYPELEAIFSDKELVRATTDKSKEKPRTGLALEIIGKMPQGNVEEVIVIGDRPDTDGGLAINLKKEFVKVKFFLFDPNDNSKVDNYAFNQSNLELITFDSWRKIIQHFNSLNNQKNIMTFYGTLFSDRDISPSEQKRPSGGTDVGMLSELDGEAFILKGGVGSLLLAQALVYNSYEGDVDGEEDSFYKQHPDLKWALNTTVETNLARDLGVDKNDAKIQSTKAKLLEVWKSKEFQEFITPILQNIKSKGAKWNSMDKALNPQDVARVLEKLQELGGEELKLLNVTTNFGVINQATSQHLLNKFAQDTYKPEIADARIVAGDGSIYLGSRVIQDAQPLNEFFVKHFEGVDTSDPKQMDAAKNNLKKSLEDQKIDGLFSNIFLRLVLGEGADNGPDNMLLKDGKIISIDATGNRSDRSNNAVLTNRQTGETSIKYGYLEILKPEVMNNKDELLKVLLDKNVLQSRYTKDPLIHEAIVECIKEVIGKNVIAEINQAVGWLSQQNPEEISSSFSQLAKTVNGGLSESLKMPEGEMQRVIDRTLQTFINGPIGEVQKVLPNKKAQNPTEVKFGSTVKQEALL